MILLHFIALSRNRLGFVLLTQLCLHQPLDGKSLTGYPLRNICVSNNHWYVPFAVIIIRYFPHLWFIPMFVARVTRRVPHVKQELRCHSVFTHGFSLSSCCSIFSFLCNVLYIMFCSFVPFLLTIVLCVLLRYTASDYPFDITKPFFFFFFFIALNFAVNNLLGIQLT